MDDALQAAIKRLTDVVRELTREGHIQPLLLGKGLETALVQLQTEIERAEARAASALEEQKRKYDAHPDAEIARLLKEVAKRLAL